MGGSLAKALQQKLDVEITAVDKDENSLKYAVEDRVIIDGKSSIEEIDLQKFDYIIFCTPIEQTLQMIREIDGKVKASCIVTDIGSTKQQVMETAREVSYDFIGGHPMVGSEKVGYANSKAHLFENAYFILTPMEGTPIQTIEQLKSMISSIGSIPMVMGAEQHDLYTAVVSHVPHIIASALVHNALYFAKDDELLLKLAAGGFKDMTRIASSNPSLWRNISISNREKIVMVLNHFLDNVSRYKEELAQHREDFIFRYFDEAKETRDGMQEMTHSDNEKQFALMVDIEDKPGMIAKISTLLYENGINIKNIGIIHNREFVNGVLKIIFENQRDQSISYEILRKQSYSVSK